ncbi:ribosome biogenesis protein [Ceratobasidium sp. AG-Ba]|nr:ribosome biogenesis protein [Ceratobasidium sp. AG-Ba]
MAITKPAKVNKGRKQKFDTSSQLKGAVRALGGDDQDLELLAGIESDGEASGTKKVTGKSQNKLASRELARFVKSLNLPASVDADQTVATKSKGKGKEKTQDRANDVQQSSNDTAPVKESTKLKLKEKKADKKVEETGRKEKSRKDKREDGVGPKKKEKELSKGKTRDDHSRAIKPLPLAKPSTSVSVSTTLPATTLNKPGKKAKLVVTPASKWYEDLPPITPSSVRLSESKLSALVDRAAALHAADTAAFSDSQFGLSTSDAHFLESVLQGGTRSDRLSALTLVVQGAPVHSTRSLEGLRAMASKKGGRGESLKALRAIVDWWVGGGCPDRKLRYFRDQPVSSSDITDAHLIVWHFEDWLKKYFFSILQLLETLSLDTLPYIRTQTMSLITLLKEKPEQEQNLLRLLVNKLAVIVREMTSLVLKPQSEQTNARVITLNQFTLAPGEKDVAAALEKSPQRRLKKGRRNEHIVRVLAKRLDSRQREREKSERKGHERRGHICRNARFERKVDCRDIDGRTPCDTVCKDRHVYIRQAHAYVIPHHSAPFNISIQALVLIEKVSSANQSISDRFYRTLYDSLLDPRLLKSSKQAMYLNLLFKAMKADTSFRRVTAFVKRLLQYLRYTSLRLYAELYIFWESLSSYTRAPRTASRQRSKTKPNPGGRGYEDPPRETNLSLGTDALPNYYHPSVSLHAKQLLTGAQLTATPDLGLNTLTHFLDRFVYRNPKKIKARPVSVLHPAATIQTAPVRLMKDTTDSTMNDKADKSEVADSDEESDDSQSGSDSESEAESELGEAEVWKAMQSSMPELQHAGDDSDSIPSGLDDMSDGSSSDGSEDSDVGQVEEEDDGSESEAPTDGSVAGGQMPNDLGDSGDDEIDFAEDEGDLIELSEGEDVSEEEPSHGKRKKSNKDEEKQKKRRKLQPSLPLRTMRK